MSKKAKEAVKQLAGKKYKVAFILMLVFIGLALLSLVSIFIKPLVIEKDSSLNNILSILSSLGIFSIFPAIILSLYYPTKMTRLKKSVKTLERTNKLHLINEILTGDYNSNRKMCFSKHLFYDKRNNIILAYDDIIWVFKNFVTASTGDGGSIDRTNIYFCMVDGTKHRSGIDEQTLSEFLARKPEILVGNTLQNEATYIAIVNNFNTMKQSGTCPEDFKYRDAIQESIPDDAIRDAAATIRKKNRKVWIIIGIVAIIFVVMFVHFLLTDRHPHETGGMPEGYTKGAWLENAYQNKYIGIRLLFPQDWKVMTEEEIKNSVGEANAAQCDFSIYSPENGSTMQIYVEKLRSAGTSMDHLKEKLVSKFLFSNQNIRTVFENKDYKIAGKSYNHVQYESTFKNTPVYTDIYLRKENNGVIYIVIQSEKKNAVDAIMLTNRMTSY